MSCPVLRFLLLVAVAALLSGPLVAQSEDSNVVESRIAWAGLFKNGIAVVRRELTLPGNGVYRLEDVPAPAHGTLWFESTADIDARVTTREVTLDGPALLSGDMQRDLAGRQVTLHFREGSLTPTQGRVVEIAEPEDVGVGPRGSSHRSAERFLLIDTDSGSMYVEINQITAVQVDDQPVERTRTVPVFELDATGAKPGQPLHVSVSYLSKGLSWAPSYRIDLSHEEQLTLTQKAIIRNELEDLDGAEIELISGFPSIEFWDVLSPMSPATTWQGFFQQLGRQGGLRHSSRGDVLRQQAFSNFAQPMSGNESAVAPTAEGVDLHYQSIGARTLSKGDTLTIEVADGRADYERIVEWIIPDTRNQWGSYNRTNEESVAWDAIRYANPLGFPMTTGPTMMIQEGRFSGQRMTQWVNSKETTTQHINKALSVRTRSVEHEQEGEREIVWIGGRRFRKATVQGTISVRSHRRSVVPMVIRRRFSGDLLEASDEPLQSLLEEGAWAVNERRELLWNVDVKPGEKKEITYSYAVLVSH